MFASNVSATIEPQAILRSVIEVYPVGVVIVGPLGNIILANSELERMFGYAPMKLSANRSTCSYPRTCNPNTPDTAFYSRRMPRFVWPRTAGSAGGTRMGRNFPSKWAFARFIRATERWFLA